jgi:hypothetical protein
VQLLRDVDAYRDRTVVPYGAAEVTRLEVAAHGGRFALERAGSTFRVERASGLRAARSEVERVFGALADARIETFLDDATASRALAVVPTVVHVTPRDPSAAPVDLELGGDCPGQVGVVAIARLGADRVSGCISSSVIDGLEVKPGALVDRGLFYAHADEIEDLRVEHAPDAPLDLARRGGGWRERAPDDHDLGPDVGDAASTLAVDVAEARATDVRAAGVAERITPQARIRVTRTGDRDEEAIEIEAPGADGFAVAHRGDDGALLRVPGDVVRRIEAKPFVLRGRAIWTEPFDPASVSSLETTCGAGRERLELRDGRWTLRVPSGFEADRDAADALADALAHAKAARWIAERDDGAFGLAAPGACSVAAQLGPASPQRPARSVAIVFGRETVGGYYAKTTESPGVFIAPETVRVMASRPAIDRERLRVDPRTVTRVTLVRGGARVVLERKGTQWVGADGDAGKGERLGDGVLEVAAEDALHSGPPARSEGFARPTLEIEAVAAGDGTTPSTTDIVVGAPTHVGKSDAYFARVSGIDATFAVARPRIDAILGAW